MLEVILIISGTDGHRQALQRLRLLQGGFPSFRHHQCQVCSTFAQRFALRYHLSSFYTPCLQVPDEYLTASRIGGKVPVVELQRSHTDLLFFNFYAGHGDRLQLTAASLLFERGWRFNIPNQVCAR